MISKVINDKEYLFVEVEKASSEFWIDKGELHYLWDYGESEDYVTIQLQAKGRLKIIGKASDLNEEQWNMIEDELPSGMQPQTTLIILKQ